VRDRVTDAITAAEDYSELGVLLIAVTAIAVAAPLLTVTVVQRSPLRTQQ
jgi:hypothetical protein